MINRIELIARRRVFKAFVEADSVSIVFERPGDKVRTAAGGIVKAAPTVLPAQTARIVQNTRRYTDGLVNSEAGEIPRTTYLLLAVHTTDVKKNDQFWWQGNRYSIKGIHPTRDESKLCTIDFTGPLNE